MQLNTDFFGIIPGSVWVHINKDNSVRKIIKIVDNGKAGPSNLHKLNKSNILLYNFAK